MRSTRVRRILFGVFACGVLVAAPLGQACAQEDAASYPSKPIRIIVGFAAGGGNDLVARIVAPKLSETLGQPVIVENRPGAAGQLAVVYAQSQSADGHTLLIGATGQLAIATAIYSNLPFHPTRSLVPLTLLGSYWLAIACSTQHGIGSLKDLVAFAKANPDKSNYPSSSPAFTIPAELFKLKTGMPGQTIPYKSTNEMMLSIAAGQTLFGFADHPIVIPLAEVREGETSDPTALASMHDADGRYLQTSPGQRFTAVFQPQSSAEPRTFFLAAQGYYTEWVRARWLRSPRADHGFVPSDSALAQALDRWRMSQDSLEALFVATRIPTR